MVLLLKLHTPFPIESIKCVLLCLPWAGGNGSYYKTWLSTHNIAFANIQLLSLNLPGRSGNDVQIVHNLMVRKVYNISLITTYLY